jgi:succinate dehydrogenase / fumarate reductase, cytochrome b subunit
MRENFFWHKVHSITGIIPVGFYMVQHLTLNSFSLGGAAKFDGVIHFFEGIPLHLLLALEIFAIWIPLAFHAVYGLFISSRGQGNYFNTKYKWSQNRMYSLQRWSGILLFFFLIYHVSATTGYKYVTGDLDRILYSGWRETLTSFYGLFLIVYGLGVLSASYHLAYGIWNFCIRWGITISERAQIRIQKFSAVFFVAITLLGWMALAGFLIERPVTSAPGGMPVGAAETPSLPAGTVP